MLFVIYANDRKGGMPTRAKFYRDHRIHLDKAGDYETKRAEAWQRISTLMQSFPSDSDGAPMTDEVRGGTRENLYDDRLRRLPR